MQPVSPQARRVIGRHRRLAAGLTFALLFVAAGIFRLSSFWPGPSLPASATPLMLVTQSARLIPKDCPPALIPLGRVAVVRDELVLMTDTGGDPLLVEFPAGWAAWRRDGRAELVSRDGTVVARDGERPQRRARVNDLVCSICD